MKQVVIVGADFVPSSLPPSLRIRFFAGHLAEFGWESTVLTTEPEYYEQPVDPENSRLVPFSVHVARTRALPASLTRKIGIGDIGLRSLWYHWKALVRLCQDRRVDLICIPVPPYVPMALGRLAYRRFGVPYVIDYIDPWVTDSYKKVSKAQRPPKWFLSDALSRIVEPFALRYVGHIVGVSKGVTDSVIARYPWLTEANATAIPYGGEPTDFDYLRRNPRQNKIFNRSDGLLHISYVGACIPGMHATVRALFEATRLGLRRAPELFSRLRMHFIGTTYAPKADGLYQVLPLARELRLEGIVDEHPGRVPYLDSLQILLDSHALLLIGYDEPYYAASKVYQSILARRPLVAVLHEASSPVTVLRETNAGEVVTFNSEGPLVRDRVEKILGCLQHVLSLTAGYEPPTRWEAFEPYTARAMAARLAQVFDKVLLKRRQSLVPPPQALQS